MATLSRNDTLVLSALFDAESKPSNINITPTIHPSTAFPSDTPQGITPHTLASLRSRENAAIRALNISDPPQDTVLTAISSLSKLIAEEPSYASAYNNRAQATRLLTGSAKDVEAAVTEATGVNFSVWSDLSTAVDLAEQEVQDSVQRTSSSGTDAERVLASAYTQRGWLLLQASMAAGERESGNEHRTSLNAVSALPASLRQKSSSQLEALAAKEFTLGGKYGNAIARSMGVKLNPTAKLCGEIVREAMVGDMKAQLEAERNGMS